MTTLYAVSVSDNPRIPIGTVIGMRAERASGSEPPRSPTGRWET